MSTRAELASPMVVDDIDVHLDGQGPVIVMVHGWPDTHRLWDATVAALASQWRCVRFDLPGFDLSKPPRPTGLDEMVTLFARIVDAVSPTAAVTLLLHDWGAVFGYEYAARYPHRVQRLAGVDVGDPTSGAYLRSLPGKAKAMIAAYQLPLAAAWRLRGAIGTRITRSVARSVRCPTPAVGIGWQMNHPYALTWTGGLRRLSRFVPACPTLYVFGTRKPFLFHSPRWEALVQATPGGRVVALRTGHWVMVDDPVAFHAVLAGWLSDTAPGAPAVKPEV